MFGLCLCFIEMFVDLNVFVVVFADFHFGVGADCKRRFILKLHVISTHHRRVVSF